MPPVFPVNRVLDDEGDRIVPHSGGTQGGEFDGVHGDLSGRNAENSHPGTAISLSPSGFDGNLDGDVTDVQKLADAVDDLDMGGEGAALPAGGTTGQALVKASEADGDVVWDDLPDAEPLPPGGTTGQALVKASEVDGDAEWGDIAEVPGGGTTGQALVKTGDSDGQVGWDDLPDALPPGGTTGQALVKASEADGDAEWGDIESGGTTARQAGWLDYLTEAHVDLNSSLPQWATGLPEGRFIGLAGQTEPEENGVYTTDGEGGITPLTIDDRSFWHVVNLVPSNTPDNHVEVNDARIWDSPYFTDTEYVVARRAQPWQWVGPADLDAHFLRARRDYYTAPPVEFTASPGATNIASAFPGEDFGVPDAFADVTVDPWTLLEVAAGSSATFTFHPDDSAVLVSGFKIAHTPLFPTETGDGGVSYRLAVAVFDNADVLVGKYLVDNVGGPFIVEMSDRYDSTLSDLRVEVCVVNDSDERLMQLTEFTVEALTYVVGWGISDRPLSDPLAEWVETNVTPTLNGLSNQVDDLDSTVGDLADDVSDIQGVLGDVGDRTSVTALIPETRPATDLGAFTGTFLDESSDMDLPDVFFAFDEAGAAVGGFWFTPAPPIPGATLRGVSVAGLVVDWGSASDVGVSVLINDGVTPLSGSATVNGEGWIVNPGETSAFLPADPGPAVSFDVTLTLDTPIEPTGDAPPLFGFIVPAVGDSPVPVTSISVAEITWEWAVPAAALVEAFQPKWTRTTSQVTTESLADDAADDTTVELAAGYRVLAVETDVPARVRLYATTAHQAADSARGIGVDPEGNHGVYLDVVTTSEVLTVVTSPAVDGVSMADPPTADIPVTITNLSGGTAAVTATFTWIRTE